MRKLIKKSMAVALSTAMVVTLGYAADIKTKAADDYTYLYAGLTWEQYWDAEDIYLQSTKSMTDANTEADARGELDKGAFDAVSRATTNHGLHRGSYQCDTVIYGEDGSEFNVSHWSADGKTLYLTDGTSVSSFIPESFPVFLALNLNVPSFCSAAVLRPFVFAVTSALRS